MNVLIVGAGAQGTPCASILARQPEVSRILLGSRTLAAATAVRDWLGSPKIAVAEFDAQDAKAIVSAVVWSLGTVDVVIDLSPCSCSMSVMRATLELGAHYVNSGACAEHIDQLFHRRPLDLADQFVAAGRTALLGCGASPGITNIICRRFCDQLETVERIEIRFGFHVPTQRAMVKTWKPTWNPEDQLLGYWYPSCVFREHQYEQVPRFHEPETYNFGGNLGEIQLTHHYHEEPYSLPQTIGKGIQYCCFKYPFEPVIATLFATGFTPDRYVEVQEVKVRAIDVLMQLLPRPVKVAALDPQVQKQFIPLMADTKVHFLIKGTAGGETRIMRIASGIYFDQADKALELFGTVIVQVAYAAVTGALQLAEGKTKPGIVWPEELDVVRFFELANTLGLGLKVSASGVASADLRVSADSAG